MAPKQALHLLETMRAFKYHAKRADFERIFGPTTGAHLWAKFRDTYEYNPLELYLSLDPRNAGKFGRALSCWYPGQTGDMERN